MLQKILPATWGGPWPGTTGRGAACPHCGGIEMAPRRVSLAFWDIDRLVVICEIPALTCRICGEDCISDETSATLAAMRRRGFILETAPRVMQVPVFPFANTPGAERP